MRALLILCRWGSRWGVPGGGWEGEEPFEETVRRVVREGVGVEISLRDVGHLRHEIVPCDGYDEHLNVLRVFSHAKYESESLAIQQGELNGAAWFDGTPSSDRLFADTSSSDRFAPVDGATTR